MCDTLCALGRDRTLFAKNSDRPVAEVQLVESFASRPGGGRLRTQYTEIDDGGAFALLGCRPEWLWGLETGVNEHRVAIGNEKVSTVDSPYAAEPALLGMDLVRLGLERGRTADEALAVMTDLLARHGQGGVGDQTHDEPYFSSFLLADPRRAWVASGSDALTPRILAAQMRHHGERPWGPPGGDPTSVSAPPPATMPDGTGVTVCMHVRGYQATASSMIVELPADSARPLRAWVAPGSPCVSVYVPVFPSVGVPRELGDAGVWKRFLTLRERVEANVDSSDAADALREMRAALGPVEADLWDGADDAAADPRAQAEFSASCWRPVASALDHLGA
jgi:hypothetical protein